MNSRHLQTNNSPDALRNGANAVRLIPSIDGKRATVYEHENAPGSEDRVIQRPQLAHSTVPTESGVLNSWKEIAAHLRRGIRTVQRWESQLGLPVHRPRGKHRSTVLAFREELDDWLHRTPLRPSANNEDAAKALLEFACNLHAFGEQLVIRLDRKTRPEGEMPVEAVRYNRG